MDILAALSAVQYPLKFLALFVPLVACSFGIRSLDRGASILTKELVTFSGVTLGVGFGCATQAARFGVPISKVVGAITGELPTGLSTTHFLVPYTTLWNDVAVARGSAFNILEASFWKGEYYTFWTTVINPLKQPFLSTVVDIITISRGNGLVGTALLLLPAIAALALAFHRHESLQRHLTSFALKGAFGFYLSCLCIWGGALLAIPVGLVAGALGFFVIGAGSQILRVRIVN